MNINWLLPAPLWLSLIISLTLTGRLHGERLMLWEVRHGNATVYLLGTVHLVRLSDYPLPSDIDRVFGEASRVVFEVNIDDMGLLENQLALSTGALYDPGDSLVNHVASSTYEKLLEYVAANGADFLGTNLPLDWHRPWFISSNIKLRESEKLGFDTKLAPDLVLFALAKTAGKDLDFLETVAFQIDILTGATEAEQEHDLADTLERIPSLGAELEHLLDAWQSGDVETVRQLLHEEEQTAPETFARLITSRNRAWTSQIVSYLQSDHTTLVVGGMAHMVGVDGVPNQLRLQGYQIRQLPELPGDLEMPRLRAGTTGGSGLAELEFAAPAGWSFALEASSDLKVWSRQLTLFTTNEIQRLSLSGSLSETSGFFRLMSPP